MVEVKEGQLTHLMAHGIKINQPSWETPLKVCFSPCVQRLSPSVLPSNCTSRVLSYRELPRLLAFCLNSTPIVTWQQPGRPDPHYKGDCLLCLFPHLLFLSCSFGLLLPSSPPPLPPSLSTCSLPFSDSTTLLTPLPMPWINSYSILYWRVTGSSGGMDALAWACWGLPLPHVWLHPQRIYPLSLYLFINTSLTLLIIV
jgi:hypothetical protein